MAIRDMVDLNFEMAELWASLNSAGSGRACVIQVVSASRGEGSSTVARELSRYLSWQLGRSVWLVDLEFGGAGQYHAIAGNSGRYGQLGAPSSATPDGSMFLTVQPPTRTANGQVWPASRLVSAHRVGQVKWWVTRFHREAVRAGQTLHVVPKPDYWISLARHTDVIIIDAPSADRSRASITLAPFADKTVLVVAADKAATASPRLLNESLAEAGGTVAGVFLNRVTANSPKLLRALGL